MCLHCIRRVALIRTLAIEPDILLLDEAFSALDYQTRLSVSDDVYKIIKKEKKTVIMVTHDIAEAISMADRIVVFTNRPALVKNIYDLAADKRIEGIDDVVDYSSKRDGGIRIIVDLKKDANPQVVLNKIYRYTALQSTFGAILLAIVNGKPQILTLEPLFLISPSYSLLQLRTPTYF